MVILNGIYLEYGMKFKLIRNNGAQRIEKEAKKIVTFIFSVIVFGDIKQNNS